MGICSDQNGYVATLQVLPYSPELEARVMSAPLTRNVKREVEKWAQKGKG